MPAAVPVVTPKEAEELNIKAEEYAQVEKTIREPFYSLYQNTIFEEVCFEGTIRAISIIPDPIQNDYDNCLYALFVEIESLLSQSGTKIASEVIVNVPIMKDKIILQDNVFLPGDKVRCTCADYDAMPQAIQEIQLSDSIQSYEHQQYYSFETYKISIFQKEGNRNFAQREITILPIQSLPKEEKAVALRKEHMQNEIARIEDELKKHGGSFQSWKEEYKPIAKKYEQLIAKKYKAWIGDSFISATTGETSYDYERFIKETLPYKEYLEKNDIDLIIVRQPARGDFAARVLGSDDFQENPAWIECYYNFLKNDIEVVDPMPEMWQHRFDYPLFFFYHIINESHPAEGSTFITSKVLSEVLKRYSYPQASTPISLTNVVSRNTNPMFFWPEGNPKFDKEQHISFHGVIQNDKFVQTSVNSGSPFLFTSNSFFNCPDRSLGATVLSYSSFFLQSIPDWMYQSGISFGPMLKNLISRPELLSGRKAVVMNMVGGPTSRDRFPAFPKYLLDGVKKISLEKTISSLINEKDNIAITSESNALIRMTDNGLTSIKGTSTAVATISFQIGIPSVPGKETCMLRLNFTNACVGHLTVTDLEEDSILDYEEIASGDNMFVDVFIKTSPATDLRKINIQYDFYSSESREVLLRNIELWYY